MSLATASPLSSSVSVLDCLWNKTETDFFTNLALRKTESWSDALCVELLPKPVCEVCLGVILSNHCHPPGADLLLAQDEAFASSENSEHLPESEHRGSLQGYECDLELKRFQCCSCSAGVLHAANKTKQISAVANRLPWVAFEALCSPSDKPCKEMGSLGIDSSVLFSGIVFILSSVSIAFSHFEVWADCDRIISKTHLFRTCITNAVSYIRWSPLRVWFVWLLTKIVVVLKINKLFTWVLWIATERRN